MYQDEIVSEIHKYREEYAKSFNYDLNLIFEDLRKKQATHSHKIVKLPIKRQDRKSTRLNSSHRCISYAVFCLKKKKQQTIGQ